MMMDVGGAQLAERLDRLVVSRYGKSLSLKSLDDADHDEDNLQAIQRSPKASVIISDQDALIPLRVQGSLIAYAIVHDGVSLHPEHLDQTVFLVREMVESFFDMTHQLHKLQTLESYLEAEHRLPENVVSLDQFRKSRGPQTSKPAPVFNSLPHLDPVLLEGPSGAGFLEWAIDLHHESKTSGFIRWSDISVDNFSSLLELGPVSLFVEDFHSLPESQRQLLCELLNYKNVPGHPKLILASTKPLEDLVDESLLGVELAQLLFPHRMFLV